VKSPTPASRSARAREELKGFAAVLFGASVLGLSAIFVKVAAAGGATPLSVGLYRMLFALPFTVPPPDRL